MYLSPLYECYEWESHLSHNSVLRATCDVEFEFGQSVIEDLKQGDEKAAARLWERYFERMVQAAPQKMVQHALVASDEEDVALSALDNVCRRTANGKWPERSGRHRLWQLLLSITAQKAVDRVRWENRQRRGGGRKIVGDSELAAGGPVTSLNDILAREPTPEILALMDEQCARLLNLLRDDTLRMIVTWKLAGHANEDIAAFLGVSVNTAGRKLRMIRLAWSKELGAA